MGSAHQSVQGDAGGYTLGIDFDLSFVLLERTRHLWGELFDADSVEQLMRRRAAERGGVLEDVEASSTHQAPACRAVDFPDKPLEHIPKHLKVVGRKASISC